MKSGLTKLNEFQKKSRANQDKFFAGVGTTIRDAAGTVKSFAAKKKKKKA